jgi:hypothetical protein
MFLVALGPPLGWRPGERGDGRRTLVPKYQTRKPPPNTDHNDISIGNCAWFRAATEHQKRVCRPPVRPSPHRNSPGPKGGAVLKRCGLSPHVRSVLDSEWDIGTIAYPTAPVLSPRPEMCPQHAGIAPGARRGRGRATEGPVGLRAPSRSIAGSQTLSIARATAYGVVALRPFPPNS